MEAMNEDQMSLLAGWLRHLADREGDTLELPPETYQGMGNKSDLVLKLSELGKEPVSGKDALYVRNMYNEDRGWKRQAGLTPEAKPLAEMLKRLKGKAVFFTPENSPVTKAQIKTQHQLTKRINKQNFDPDGLSYRAEKVLMSRAQKTRTELFERMLGKKSISLGRMGRVIFPALLLAALLKRQQGQGMEETS